MRELREQVPTALRMNKHMHLIHSVSYRLYHTVYCIIYGSNGQMAKRGVLGRRNPRASHSGFAAPRPGASDHFIILILDAERLCGGPSGTVRCSKRVDALKAPSLEVRKGAVAIEEIRAGCVCGWIEAS